MVNGNRVQAHIFKIALVTLGLIGIRADIEVDVYTLWISLQEFDILVYVDPLSNGKRRIRSAVDHDLEAHFQTTIKDLLKRAVGETDQEVSCALFL